MSAEPEILFESRGCAGLVTLNRPKALNAVTHGMVQALTAKLREWTGDPRIRRIVVDAAGERAFSAGGDIRALYELGQAGRHDDALAFWRDEYRLNITIKAFPKPYIALIDGIVMGGGVGVAIHGSHRIAGDRFQFAMPEVGIGFFPDVGATHFLPRLPGQIGTYCALTGERMRTADALATGIATDYVPSARLGALREALTERGPIEPILREYARPAPQGGALTAQQARIDRFFRPDQVDAIVRALDAETTAGGEEGGWAGATAASIRSKSPTSLKIALAQMRLGRTISFEHAMIAEFRIVSRLIYGSDFYEGVRATILDKDNRPRWSPSTLAGVSAAEVDRHFAPLGRELDMP